MMSQTQIKRPGLEKQKSKDHLHVNFLNAQSEQNHEKKKYLTAKFELREINLIRKRLEIENWMFDQLNELYKSDEASDTIEIDLDNVLEIERDEDKTKYLLNKLRSVKKEQNEIDKFITCLLEKLKALVN